MAPAPASTPSVADRLSDAQRRLASTDSARKWYRFRIEVSPHGGDAVPAPFSAVTIGTKATPLSPSRPFTFQDVTLPWVPNPRDPKYGKPRQVERAGSIAQATEAEIASLKERIKDYVVRWMGRTKATDETGPKGNADIIDTTIPANMDSLNPETDEPLGPYLVIEGPFDSIK